jgi:hypothetical protein
VDVGVHKLFFFYLWSIHLFTGILNYSPHVMTGIVYVGSIRCLLSSSGEPGLSVRKVIRCSTCSKSVIVYVYNGRSCAQWILGTASSCKCEMRMSYMSYDCYNPKQNEWDATTWALTESWKKLCSRSTSYQHVLELFYCTNIWTYGYMRG